MTYTAEEIMPLEHIAKMFLLQGIQHWGQSAEAREKAVINYVLAAGLEPGTTEAKAWLDKVLATLQRGKFEHEAEQLICFLKEARSTHTESGEADRVD